MRVISLFSGCGGLDLGFSQSGLAIETGYDIDPQAIETYNRNNSGRGEQQDITANFNHFRPADIIVATPPCQGFSTAGKHDRFDPRNNLLKTSFEIIAKHRPKVAVIENVAAITNKRNIGFLQHALKTLSDANYHVEVIVLNCEEFSIPQRRKRAFIVARENNKHFETLKFRKPTKLVTVNDVLSDIPKDANSHITNLVESRSKHAKILEKIKPGQKLCNVRGGAASVPTWDIPKVFGIVTKSERDLLTAMRKLRRRNRVRTFGDADPVSREVIQSYLGYNASVEIRSLLEKKYLRAINNEFDLTHTFNGKYRRLDPNNSSPTVDTRFGEVQLFVHPWEDRGLSVREAARIQCFPDSFEFYGDSRSKYRQIGNAVPPPLAKEIANYVKGLV